MTELYDLLENTSIRLIIHDVKDLDDTIVGKKTLLNVFDNRSDKIIQLFKHEIDNRFKQVRSFLKSTGQKNHNIIYARKCDIREVSKAEAKQFLNDYHILGAVMFKVALGMYYNNELMCMATFGRHHRDSSQIVLNRFVGREDYSIAGGLSKLCKSAYKQFGSFTTWIDLRISDGSGWVNAGWVIENRLKPDYFYYNPMNGKIISKQSRRKSAVKTPEGMTEREHSKKDGLITIWDCGKIKLRYL